MRKMECIHEQTDELINKSEANEGVVRWTMCIVYFCNKS